MRKRPPSGPGSGLFLSGGKTHTSSAHPGCHSRADRLPLPRVKNSLATTLATRTACVSVRSSPFLLGLAEGADNAAFSREERFCRLPPEFIGQRLQRPPFGGSLVKLQEFFWSLAAYPGGGRTNRGITRRGEVQGGSGPGRWWRKGPCDLGRNQRRRKPCAGPCPWLHGLRCGG